MKSPIETMKSARGAACCAMWRSTRPERIVRGHPADKVGLCRAQVVVGDLDEGKCHRMPSSSLRVLMRWPDDTLPDDDLSNPLWMPVQGPRTCDAAPRRAASIFR